MPFVLIVAFATANGFQQYPSFTMQEFTSKSSCDAAKAQIESMSAAMANTNREVVRAKCVPK